jgi:uncharacterized protein
MHQIATQFNEGADATRPRVWVIPSYRAGENSQLLGLAERLGLPFAVKPVIYRRHAASLALARLASVAGITRETAATLAPPWPELLITAGLRNEPLCRYVRRASGGHTRVVFLGRAWHPLHHYDLIVTTPQYRVRPAPNVLTNRLTQHRVTPARLADAATRHRARFATFPRPLIGVLLGGHSGPYVLGPRNAARLAAGLLELSAARGGTLLITSSARTPTAFFEHVVRDAGAGAFSYSWHADDPENPYFAILALASELVVTGDSVAMLSEAAATGKPVHVFDIATDARGDSNAKARAYRAMMRWLPARATRDVALFHRQFVEAGYGRWLGDEREPPPGNALPPDDTVQRVLGLIGALPPQPPPAASPNCS